jgi:ribose transport system permease protein
VWHENGVAAVDVVAPANFRQFSDSWPWIGGANLSGGAGTAIGEAIGATLIEVIRNSLLLLGVDAFWQGTFVGSFIVLAVMLDKLKGARLAE